MTFAVSGNRYITGLCMLGIICACNGDRPSNQPSAGTNDTVVVRPAYMIGTNDELERPVSATRLADGRTLVVDAFGQNVAMFDENGQLVRRIGRAGSGPGEFQVPNWVEECEPGKIFVSDAVNGRITVLDTAGNLVRSFNMLRMPVASCRNGVIAGLRLLS